MDNPDVVMFGMMSSMRTGNMIVDMAVCLLLPFLFRALWDHIRQYYRRFAFWLKRRLNRQYRRTITHQRSNKPWQATKDTDKNKVLISALRTYIGREIKPVYPMGDYKLQAIKSKSGDGSGKTLVDQLEKRYNILCVPSRGSVPVEVAPGLFFSDAERYAREETDDKKSGTLTMTTELVLTTDLIGGRERVDAFIAKAYSWYVDQVEKAEDHSFFMYQPLVAGTTASSSEDKKGSKSTQYKRYRLSFEKTFNSIFFPERAKVLQILGHFAEKTGKFSIKGFPHKLGLLLHGPPGTGKTSLVKAIAAHTKRHIISVPLSRIRTNQELMDVMFDQVFPYVAAGGGGGGGDDDDDDGGGGGGGGKQKHKIDEVVFLLEDVDAASKVVHARGEEDTLASPSKKKGGKKRRGSKVAAGDEEEDGEATMTMVMSEALTRQATTLEEMEKEGAEEAAAAEGGDADKKKDGDAKEEGDGDEDGDKKKSLKKKKDSLWDDADKLDLAGLLNVLDGVVDAPGRILVMTTNHPEKLDRALLRPGRVNMRIYMGFINCDDAMRMTRHYYPGSSEADVKPVREAFDRKAAGCKHGLKMSPAEFEQLCAESSTLANLCSAIDFYVPKRK